jgi:hypothetical protein
VKNLAIELFGGPHDGFSIECLLTPPPYFLLPLSSETEIASIYYFDSVFFSEGCGRLRYAFSGYQAITSAEFQQLRECSSYTSGRYR